MRIHITRAGWNLIAVILGVVAIFLMLGGYGITLKVIEAWRVQSIPDIKEQFVQTDIQYDATMASLKDALNEKYNDMVENKNNLENLKSIYPDNKDIVPKLTHYENYLASLKNAQFDCPEHNCYYEEEQSYKCDKCNGNGYFRAWYSLWLVKHKCKNCEGCGEVKITTSGERDCPNCGQREPGKIPATKILDME